MRLMTLAFVDDMVVAGVGDLDRVFLVDDLLLTLDTPASSTPRRGLAVEVELSGNPQRCGEAFVGADSDVVLAVEVVPRLESKVRTAVGAGGDVDDIAELVDVDIWRGHADHPHSSSVV